MKQVTHILFIISILWFTIGCKSIPDARKAYDGPDKSKEQLAYFYMKNHMTLSSPDALLFKVDGKTGSDVSQYWRCYSEKGLGFNVAVLPGMRSFEFIIDNNHVENVSFMLQSASDYEFLNSGKDLSVFKKTPEGDKAVDIKRVIIAPYKEPEKSAPHGTLVQNNETMKEGTFHIYRVDGLPGTVSFGHWWGTIVYDNFELRLTPGKHIIDYQYFIEGQQTARFLTMEINVKSGKKYRMRVSNYEKINKDLSLAETEVVDFE